MMRYIGEVTNRLLQITREFKKQLSVYNAAIRHPRTPRLPRWLLIVAIAYLASPIDLIPDFIPVLGHLDDLIIIPALVALAVRLIPQDVLAECSKFVERAFSGSARCRFGISQQALMCLADKPSLLASLLFLFRLKSSKNPGNPGKVKSARDTFLFLPGADCRSADAPLLRGSDSREAMRVSSCLNALINRFFPHF